MKIAALALFALNITLTSAAQGSRSINREGGAVGRVGGAQRQAPQEGANVRCPNSAACNFTKSRMLVGAWPVSLSKVSVMRS
jgi:hypothetical protein